MNKQQTRPKTMQKTYYTMRLCPLAHKEREYYRKCISDERGKVRKLEAEHDNARTHDERDKALFAMDHPERVIEEYTKILQAGYRKEWYPLPARK